MNEQTIGWIKAELQSRGVKVPHEMRQELDERFNVPGIMSGRFLFNLEDPEGDTVSVFTMDGDFTKESPYHLKKEQDAYAIYDNGSKYTDISFPPRPKFYDMKTSDGTPMNKVVALGEPGHVRTAVTQHCYYWGIGKACKFCAVKYWWDSNVHKTPLQIAESIEAAVKEGVVEHVSLSTGTLNTPDKGLKGELETIKLILERVQVPIMIEFEPVDDLEWLKTMKDAGVGTVFCNIESFDDEVRLDIMPGKGVIPISKYVETWDKCIELFGKNEVFTTVIVGIGEDDESIMKGVEFAAKHGVMASIVPHFPTTGSKLAHLKPPGTERMVRLYQMAGPIFEKYGLNPFVSDAGCAKGGAFTALKDVLRFGA